MLDFAYWLLIFSRVTALFAVFPVFSNQNIPIQVRLGLAGFSSLLLFPFVTQSIAIDMSVLGVARVLFCEISVGLILGFVCRLLFNAIEIAGAMIANEMGLTMTGILNPMTMNQTPVTSNLLHLLAVVLFFCLDLHAWFIIGLQKSYGMVPVGGAVFSEALLSEVLTQVSGIFGVALQLTAPVVAVSFVITIIFALVGRILPQINVLSESFPVRTLAGLFVFGSTTAILGQQILNFLGRIPHTFQSILRLMAGA